MKQKKQQIFKSPLSVGLFIIWTIVMVSVMFIFAETIFSSNVCKHDAVVNNQDMNFAFDGNFCLFKFILCCGACIIIYTIYDIIRCRILEYNPSVLWRGIESLFLSVLVYVCFLNAAQEFLLYPLQEMWLSLFAIIILFLWPVFLFVIIMRFIYACFIKKFKSPLRLFLFIIWSLVMLVIAFLYFSIMDEDLADGGCLEDLSINHGIYNIAYYEKVCAFTFGFYLMSSVTYSLLYIIYDAVRRCILGCNPSVLWRFMEIFCIFIFYFVTLMNLSPQVFFISLAGTLQFFWPFFLFAVVARFVHPFKMFCLWCLGIYLIHYIMFHVGEIQLILFITKILFQFYNQ